jgi:hypothetical protein
VMLRFPAAAGRERERGALAQAKSR